MKPNLSKVLADRKASVDPKKIDERLLEEIRKVFTTGGGIERIYFPTKSGQISDTAQSQTNHYLSRLSGHKSTYS